MIDLEEIKALPVYPKQSGSFDWYSLPLGVLIKKIHSEPIDCYATTEFAIKLFNENRKGNLDSYKCYQPMRICGQVSDDITLYERHKIMLYIWDGKGYIDDLHIVDYSCRFGENGEHSGTHYNHTIETEVYADLNEFQKASEIYVNLDPYYEFVEEDED